MISLERFCDYFSRLYTHPFISRYGGTEIGQVSFLIKSGYNECDLDKRMEYSLNVDDIDGFMEYFNLCSIKDREWINIDYNKFIGCPFDLDIDINQSDGVISFSMFGSIDKIFKTILSILEAESFIKNPPKFKIDDRIIYNTMTFLVTDYIYDVEDKTMSYVCMELTELNNLTIISESYRIIGNSDAGSDRNFLINSIIS